MDNGNNQGIGLVRCYLLVINEKPKEENVNGMDILKESYKDGKDSSDEKKSPGMTNLEEVRSSKVEVEALTTEKQRLPVVRQSERVQDQILKKYKANDQEGGKKRSLEGNISTRNSFFLFLIMMKLLP
jgi:hypothetical protein